MTTHPRNSLLHLNRDSIVAQYGLETLGNIGVIDLQSGQAVIEETAANIHPAFVRDRWALDHQDDWQFLEPVLRLASCYLNESSVLPFFSGLLERGNDSTWRPLEGKAIEDKWKRKVWMFDALHGKDAATVTRLQTDTWKRLAAMRACVRWRFHELAGPYAITVFTNSAPDLAGPKTKASVIKVNRNYLRVLKGQTKSTEYVKTGNFDQGAALLRTRMHMAMIVCHEFTHALLNATWAREDNEWAPTPSTTTTPLPPLPPLPPEPFFRDDRISELGWAFQQYAFGGLLRPIGNFHPNSADATFPYGFFLEHFPGAIKKDDEYMRKFQRATPSQWGVTTRLRHGVHMNYVQKQFTKKFWNKTVLLSGGHLRVQDHEKVASVEDVVW